MSSGGQCLCSKISAWSNAKKRWTKESEEVQGVCECPVAAPGELEADATIGIAAGAGAIGLLLVVLIAWLILRRRRRQRAPVATNAAPPSDADLTSQLTGNYGRIGLPTAPASASLAAVYDQVDSPLYTPAPPTYQQVSDNDLLSIDAVDVCCRAHESDFEPNTLTTYHSMRLFVKHVVYVIVRCL